MGYCLKKNDAEDYRTTSLVDLGGRGDLRVHVWRFHNEKGNQNFAVSDRVETKPGMVGPKRDAREG